MSREIMTPQIIGGIYPLPFCQPPAPWMGVLCPPASSPGVLGLAAHGRRWGSTFGAHPKTGVSFCRRVPPPHGPGGIFGPWEGQLALRVGGHPALGGGGGLFLGKSIGRGYLVLWGRTPGP